ncbi:MAG: hypothetical protein ACYDGN_09730 [Acidimicrobiales bacterium]
MSAEEVDRAVRRVEARRPDLNLAVQAVAGGLTAGEGVRMIHQAALQQYLWWYMPRDFPDDEWQGLVEAAAALLDELGLPHLAKVASSEATEKVLAAWAHGREKGAAVFRAAHAKSGVDPPDTALLAWGSIMGADEARALDTVERALGDAVAAGNLVPGAPRWQAKASAITDAVLSRPLDMPPGQTLAGLVTTERVGTWIDDARHPVHQEWRSAVANRLLHPVEPPSNPGDAVAPMRWLLQLAAEPGGTELTQNHYLARTTVVAAVERFGWWDWEKPPRSEADVHQLSTLRDTANRLRLLRRRGRRLHVTIRGAELLASPERFWEAVATETEDGEDFTHMVTEVVGLRLLQGRVEQRKLVADVAPILIAQGWSTGGGPITVNHVSSAVHRPLRWWRLFDAIDEVEATWEYGTARELTPHTIALTSDGERMVLADLRSRAAGPRQRVGDG